MESNYNELINLLKEIFNKGLKNGAYNVDDANNFIETIKKINTKDTQLKFQITDNDILTFLFNKSVFIK